MVRSEVQHSVVALFPVEWGLVVLDVPGLQNTAGLGVVVVVNHHGLQ